MGLAGSEQAAPEELMAMVTKLLTTAPAVRTETGTQQPAGELAGSCSTIWSTPEQQGERPW
jgi:hypothetical protein